MNDTPESVTSATTLTQLLEPERLLAAGVDLDAVALTDGSSAFTWRDYAREADRVAVALAEVGVRPGDRVGIRIPKTAWSFVVVHGVLRAGAVVVPVDPVSTPEHARTVLSDADVSATVLDHRLRGTADVAAASGAAVVVPESSADWAGDAGLGVWRSIGDVEVPESGRDPADRSPDDDAYLVYTSGSTGRPKGIVHTHASAMAYARAAVATYGVSPKDRAANIAGLHFDQSTFELYAAPLAGASTLVVPDVALRFPASTVRLLHDQRTTIWYTVPHVLRQLVERGGLADLTWDQVRLVKYGGESYPPAMLRDLMAALPAATVSNVYGPAEVNQCTAHDLDEPPADDRAVPIGRAWEAAALAIVDPDDPTREIEHGTGALLVAAPTMMRCYWNQPELTAERVIGRPGDGRRWYVTGDLVERDHDGLLRFVGRVDHQVKVRGQRVELEAVDAAIAAVPGVRSGIAVVDRTDPAGDAVVAVVEMEDGRHDEDGLERRLAAEIGESLPPAAAPGRVLIVPAVPRTTSGKLDRGAATSLLLRA